jgi:hypothetical protein
MLHIFRMRDSTRNNIHLRVSLGIFYWMSNKTDCNFNKRFFVRHLSKRNVKLILKIFSDLEPLRGSSSKKRGIQLVLM